jgi:hypothetical protein
MILTEIAIPISSKTLLRLYYYDKLWAEGMPLFEELELKTIGYLLDSECFALFCNSKRAGELQLEMLAEMN